MAHGERIIGTQRRKACRQRGQDQARFLSGGRQRGAHDQLAADRTIFAAERTYAAWVRSGLLALASGIGAKALLTGLVPQWLVMATGSVLVLFSAFCFGAAIWRHLYPGAPPPRTDVPHIPA